MLTNNKLQSLIYSEIECEVLRGNICKKVKVPIKEYGNHLVEHHKCLMRTIFSPEFPYKDGKLAGNCNLI